MGDTYTTTDGRVLGFVPGDLEPICDDLLPQLGGPAPVTLDGKPLSTGTAVSTPEVARVGQNAGHFYTDSQAVGHPGTLDASYCGWKTVLRLRPGRHEPVVDLTKPDGASTVLTYWICVR